MPYQMELGTTTARSATQGPVSFVVKQCKRRYGHGPASRIGSASPSCTGRHLLFRAHQAELDGPAGGGCPARYAQLREDGRDVVVDGLGGDEQLRGDLGVGV